MKTTPWKKEWDILLKAEEAYIIKGAEKKSSSLERLLEEKVPAKLRATLESAFEKAFRLILEKGTGVIEKTYKREEIDRQYKVNRFSLELLENRKSLRAFSKLAESTGAKNVLLSGAKGVGLGLLGIGIPDIPIFIGVILKSIYEIALQYGYTYDTNEESYFVLGAIETAMSYGDELSAGNARMNAFIEGGGLTSGYSRQAQISAVSSALSTEVLCMKFLQGIPLVGVVGGVSDAIFVGRILKYAKLKYKRRFLYDRRYGKSRPAG